MHKESLRKDIDYSWHANMQTEVKERAANRGHMKPPKKVFLALLEFLRSLPSSRGSNTNQPTNHMLLLACTVGSVIILA